MSKKRKLSLQVKTRILVKKSKIHFFGPKSLNIDPKAQNSNFGRKNRKIAFSTENTKNVHRFLSDKSKMYVFDAKWPKIDPGGQNPNFDRKNEKSVIQARMVRNRS